MASWLCGQKTGKFGTSLGSSAINDQVQLNSCYVPFARFFCGIINTATEVARLVGTSTTQPPSGSGPAFHGFGVNCSSSSSRLIQVAGVAFPYVRLGSRAAITLGPTHVRLIPRADLRIPSAAFGNGPIADDFRVG